MVALSVKGWMNYLKRQLPFQPTRSQLKARAARQQYARLKARYDAAETTSENAQHWMMADDLSAQAANSLAIRRTLRRRSRYEVANNCYACGMLLTIANDLIGSGPRLQSRALDTDVKGNRTIERKFANWCRAVGLAKKLRTAVVTKKRDGEAFLRFVSNPHNGDPVWLDIELLEGDQVTTPALVPTEWKIDGITYDQWHNPDTYQILRQHPGDQVAIRTFVPENVPASQVIHWFRVDRPGQRRGVPEILPALPLFAQLRRFTLSVITAAETASDHAAVLESTASTAEDTDGDLSSLNPFDDVPYARGLLTAVPFGWKLSQLRAEQPTTTYAMFKAEILNEIARCLNMPFNVAAGNSAGYNYSSGRLDHKGYFGAIGIEQGEAELQILDRIFRAWYAEASLIKNGDGTPYVPAIDLSDRPWAFAWDPPADIDPVKTSQAQQIDLMCGATTLRAIYAAKGLELETEMQDQADALNLPLEKFQELLVQKIYGTIASSAPMPDDASAEARRRRKQLARAKRTLGI